MDMIYDFSGDSSLEGVRFNGLTGQEYVKSTKEALNVMKIKNPAILFKEDAKAGAFNEVSDEKYEQMLYTIKTISTLWHYPGEPDGNSMANEMNILMLLANAIELISRQDVEIRRRKAPQRRR